MTNTVNDGGMDQDKKISDRADKLIEKGKDLADHAEGFFAQKINKVKSSDAFGKMTDFLDKAENFIEEKSQEFQSGEMGAKFDAFKDKTEIQAEDLMKKAKEAGRKFGDQVDETLDQLKGKKAQANNQNGGGI